MNNYQPLDALRTDIQETDACRALCWSRWQVGFRENVWDEICSEFDARRLASYVSDARLPVSMEFRRFETAWLHDEDQHYRGFRRLYARLYDLSEDEITAKVEARTSTFPWMADFLSDEFHLCVMLAYDEIVTANAYARDFAIYDTFGDRQLSAWIRQVCRDESRHCLGVVRVLQTRHAARIAEIPHVLDALLGVSATRHEYSGSFVLDHQAYPAALVERGRQAILRLCVATPVSRT